MSTLVLAALLTMTLDERVADSKKTRQDLDLLTLLEGVADNELQPIAKAFVADKDDILWVRSPAVSTGDLAELAKFKGAILVMNQLTALPAGGAAALAAWSGKSLLLNGVSTLSAADAAALAKWKGEKLFLDGLKKLDAPLAKALGGFGGKMLSLRGAVDFPPDAIAALSGAFKGSLAIKLDHREAPKPVTGNLREQLIAMDRAITSGDVEAVRAFLKGGGDPNINEHGTSLLIEAADFKQLEIVKLLLAAKADTEMETRDGETALTYAAKVNEFNRRANNDPKVIREVTLALLAAKANPNPPHAYAQPLALAVELGDAELVKALLKAGAKLDGAGNRGATALLSAVNKVKLAMVKQLLAAGAKVKPPTNGMGLNPFHRAFQAGPGEISMVVYREKDQADPKKLKQLRDDSLAIVHALIDAKADLNAPDDQGNTPLHLLARMEGFDEAPLLELAALMTKKGAKKGAPNQNGKTAAQIAEEKGRAKLAAYLH